MYMNTRVKLAILFICIVFSTLNAQRSRHNMSIFGGIGKQGLNYSALAGNTKINIGQNFGVEYLYQFKPLTYFRIGVNVRSLMSEAYFNGTVESADIDTDGENYVLRTIFTDLIEKQKTYALSIPVGIARAIPIDEKNSIMFTVGANVMFGMRNHYEVTQGSIELRGFYSQWNLELYDLPQHGFFTTNERYTGSYSTKTMFSAFFDAEWDYRVFEKDAVFIRGTVESGVNNVYAGPNRALFQKDGIYNGVLNSSYTAKVYPVVYNISIGYRINLQKIICHCNWY